MPFKRRLEIRSRRRFFYPDRCQQVTFDHFHSWDIGKGVGQSASDVSIAVAEAQPQGFVMMRVPKEFERFHAPTTDLGD